ncbi:MAG: VacJ family lipoprotein [Pseudomonadales bacterium]
MSLDHSCHLIATCLLIASLASCSTLQGPELGVYDRNESINRSSFNIMEGFDTFIGKPAARAYQTLLPDWAEKGISHFFLNLRTVDSALNAYLQGNVEAGTKNVGRVLINSTLGVGGLFDVASQMNIDYRQEDFGQTLAHWGYTRSRYVYFPVIGPTTVRDLPGDLFHLIISPRLLLGNGYDVWVGSVDTLSRRSDALLLTDARDDAALDKYIFTREAFNQKRRFDILNGQLPVDDSMFDDLDDWDDLDADDSVETTRDPAE